MLKQDTELMKKYDSLFKEQKDLGIIEEVSESPALGETHYIPYHLVIREDHSTTKSRIVFDASSKTDGLSLNDCFYKGPQMTLLTSVTLLKLCTLCLRTDRRQKSFLAISIDKDNRNFLRFLWLDEVFSNEATIVRNQFARVVFGVTGLPFLLNGVMRKHLGRYQYDFDDEFVQRLIDSFYVDDFAGGANSLERLNELFKKLKLRFIDGPFDLRKCRINKQNLRKIIGNENPSSKIVGIIWNEKENL